MSNKIENCAVGILESKDSEDKDISFETALKLAQQLHTAKDATYGDSWRKNGEFLSIFANVSRKYDRLRNIVVAHVDEGKPLPKGDAAVVQNVMDLLVYCGLWLTYIAEKRPEEMKELLVDIKNEWDNMIATSND